MKNKHIPVLAKSIEKNLNKIDKGIDVDLTLGSGGHAMSLLGSNELLLFDLDKRAWGFFKDRLISLDISFDSISDTEILVENKQEVHFHNKNFVNLVNIIRSKDNKIVNLIADLGPSQNQLDSLSLGLSYKKDSYLDMRLSDELGVTAADLLNSLSKKQLAKLFSYGDVKKNHPFIAEIINYREQKPFENTFELNQIISKFSDLKYSQIYQALRMAVNLEVNNLESLIQSLPIVLHENGVAQIITFHSGEEKILVNTVKNTKEIQIKRILKPNKSEINQNKRSRSSKLYILMLSKT